MKIKEDAKNVLNFIKKYKNIYTFGNGGSASIANHMACDWMKSTKGRWTVTSLSSNGTLLSAIANDLGYQHTCAMQIDWHIKDTKKDVLVLISSSGTSENVSKAAMAASCIGIPLVCFTGFTGGCLKRLANISVHIDSNDYGIVEDYHSQVMHEVVRQLKEVK